MSRGMLQTGGIVQPVVHAAVPVDGPGLFRDGDVEDLAIAAPLPAALQSFASELQTNLGQHSLAQLRLRSYATLLLIDGLSIAVGFAFASLIRFGEPLAKVGIQYTVDFGAVFLAIAFSGGAYAVEVLEHPRKGLVRVVKAMALATFALLLGLFYTKTSSLMSRAVFAIGVATAAGLIVSARYAFGLNLGRRNQWKFQNEVLLVDNAIVPASSGTVVYAQSAGISPYDNDPNFADRVGELLKGSDHIVLACSPERRAPWLKVLKGVGVDVEVLTPELDQLGALALRSTGAGAAVLVAAGPLGLRDRIVKRMLDLVLALAFLILLAPLILLTAAAIKLSSEGPVFFRQRRIGRGNHPFEVLKFRTMRLDACDAIGSRSASRGDDRVTTVGAVLRQTSIDELPQLLNVLKGEMSIVGPRPHAAGSTAENDFFWNIDDRYWQRGAVKPGITGLAQIRGFRGATGTRKDVTDRVQSDLEYLADWSVWKDVAIILRTIRVLVHPNAF
jgi:polysaccharide biosynthesis protein PslA